MQIGPLCKNSDPPPLPGVSLEGITGNWNPGVIRTDTTGTFTYTFTPDNPSQCGTVTSMSITITTQITPTFTQIGPLCQNSIPPTLPGVSLEGITGNWNPSSINTTVAGTFTYTFTPNDPSQCGTVTSMNITITTQITPTFTQIGPLCQNSDPPLLPLVSLEGITGTWSPSSINTTVAGTFTYTFTPNDPSQCGIVTTMNITITLQITPTFTQMGPLCQNSIPPTLPGTSLEGITGTWNPSSISTTVAGTFTYTFTPNNPFQCGIVTTMSITITPQVTPTFTQIGPLCQNSIPPTLPGISLEGITGTWSPSSINTTVAGTFIYTFTPDDPSQCGIVTSMSITITPQVTPTFTQIGPLCQNSDPPSLPGVSLESITGTWNPDVISTDIPGTFTYTFTPDDPSQCGIVTTMNITITLQIIPTFTQIGPLCQNSDPPSLPGISLEGITGTWSPSSINTTAAGIFTYIFTPNDPSQCGTVTTMSLTINPQITPTYTQIGPLCQNSEPPSLPGVSLEGITGTWSPSSINTTVAGTFTYTFTPDDPSQCGTVTTMSITINPQVTPTFTQIGPLCQNSIPPTLPGVSLEGITGTWNPSSINTTVAGTFTYTFTPNDQSQCGIVTTMSISISPQVTPTFAQIGPLCQNSIPPTLPGVSLEGITGTWSPSSINTTVAGTFTYNFTPDDPSQCGIMTSMNITITPQVTPTFSQIGPLCQNSDPPTFPGTSLEGITGTWSPSSINTIVAGAFTYTFTPNDPSQCGTVTTMNITITPQVTPTFTQIGPLCQNSIPPALPGVSLEGITGTWNPSSINTTVAGTFTYTFTPDDPSQCGIVTSMDITITPQVTPTFTQIGPLCQNSDPPSLPGVSLEGITGTWSPSSINTTVAGTFTYTFTPDNPSQCGLAVTTDIIVTEKIDVSINATNVSCFGGNDGTATLIVSGGSAPYTFLWSNGQVTNPAVNLVAGTYTITITDTNDCRAIDSVTITQPPSIMAYAETQRLNL